EQQRARTVLLDEFRKRSQADLDTLTELTRLLPPPIWTTMIEVNRDSVVIGGEADQAAPLLKILDGSPFFQNSEFAMSVVKAGPNEVFRIKTGRKAKP
ncbi:MAG: PilN domain-containing protein, partial [Acidobacteriota bacterium]|nr:PilN domain-containing protein [Acidobacteriota bacterium]